MPKPAVLQPDMAAQSADPNKSVEQTICAYVRQGAYPQVAALAVGLSLEEFEKWMTEGEDKPSTRLGEFRRRVLEAQAQARVIAETEQFKKDKLAWLKHGPGKEKPGVPGWSSPSKAQVQQGGTQINVFQSPEWIGMLQKILDALTAFPEARVAVAAALNAGEQPARLIKTNRGDIKAPQVATDDPSLSPPLE